MTKPRKSTPSNLGQFYQAIAFTRNGKGPEREPRTVGRVNLFSHGSPRNVALHGHIKPIGEKGERGRGYYSRENVSYLDAASGIKRRLGWHMVNRASSFSPEKDKEQ
jgi:hypothetical protein